MTARTQTMFAVGDIILALPDGESFFTLAAPTLKTGDVVVGNGDVLFTSRGIKTISTAFPACDPSNMSAFPFAGFNVVTLAHNHTWDSGVPAIEDTIAKFRDFGIATVGAGMNIDEARSPVVVEKEGTRFGFLNYNCVGPKESWATKDKPGCAYVKIITKYELDYDSPGGTPTAYTFAEPSSLKAMVDDIHKLRPLCDVLVVYLHKGLVHIPIKLAFYDQEVSYAAIDAGADLVLGSHAHIMKGIEQYKGKTIFHGLGHFVAVSQHLTVNPTPEMKKWAKKRRELFGFEPDPEYPTQPFHPEARQTIIAKCTIDGGRISRVSYLPCLINKQGQPEILKNDERGQQVFQYVDKITREAELNALYKWEKDEVVIYTE